MFKCQSCKRVSELYEKPLTFIVETRKAIYEERWEGDGRKRELADKGGIGTEIVKEVSLCHRCHSERVEYDQKPRTT